MIVRVSVVLKRTVGGSDVAEVIFRVKVILYLQWMVVLFLVIGQLNCHVIAVETSVLTVSDSSFQNYTHPDDHTRQTTDTPKVQIACVADETHAKVQSTYKLLSIGFTALNCKAL